MRVPKPILIAFLLAAAAQGASAAHLPVDQPTGRTVFDTGAEKVAGEVYLYGGPVSLEGRFEDTLGLPDLQGWQGVDRTDDGMAPFAGDFSKLIAQATDLDPCRENTTPQMAFLDDGTPPNNATASTGGSTSPNWTYGVPGAWVVNFTGGLSGGLERLHNEVWSPEILWDLPGTADDSADGGAILRYDVWNHLPLNNGVFHTWAVRSYPDPTSGGWTPWRDRGLYYYSETAAYESRELQVGDLLVQSPQKVQIALGVIDAGADFGLPGGDATPGPWFDNVSLSKHAVDGPIISFRNVDLFQDTFAYSGNRFDPMDLADQVCRVDVALDINAPGTAIVPGDSLVIDVTPTRAGSSLASAPVMTWILRANTLFDPVRVLPSGATMIFPDVYSGTVAGTRVATHSYAFDLPDGPPRTGVLEPAESPFFFPGDFLWYYVEAEDDLGGQSLFLSAPDDDDVQASEECGGSTGGTRPDKKPATPAEPDENPGGLPPIWGEPSGDVYEFAPFLLWNDSGSQDEEDLVLFALAEIGLLQGRDYDVYTTQAAGFASSNGLGATGGHGADPVQLEEYDCILYLGGAATAPLISDGSAALGNDKGDDVSVLTLWRNQMAPRAMIYFADNMGSSMTSQGSVTAGYLSSVQGVSFVDPNVRDDVGDQGVPKILPATVLSSVFTTEFAVDLQRCDPPRDFDHIVATGGGLVSHQFTNASGQPLSGPAAGVWHDRMVTVNGRSVRRLDVTFPFGFGQIRNLTENGGTGSARARLLREILLEWGHPAGPLTESPQAPVRYGVSKASPNPFNPSTVVWVHTPDARRVSARVYDAKGRRIRDLIDERLEPGSHPVQWNGRDDAGASVASGLYFFEILGGDRREVRKAILVK